MFDLVSHVTSEISRRQHKIFQNSKGMLKWCHTYKVAEESIKYQQNGK